MSTEMTDTTPERLALSVADLAKALGVSDRHIWKMLADGRLGVQPFRLGRAVRFSRDAVEKWIAAACPPRERWEAICRASEHGVSP
jgi:excisionase family DNA binding protein